MSSGIFISEYYELKWTALIDKLLIFTISPFPSLFLLDRKKHESYA